LDKHFPDLVDVKFTARMERTLDEISTGEAQWLPYLKRFYSGDEGLAGQVEARESQIDPTEARTVDLSDLSAKVRIGKYGPYIEAIKAEEEGSESETVRASIPLDVSPADLNDEQVQVLLKQKTEGPEKLGLHPENGEPIYALIGPYGPYVRLGDKTEENPKPKQVSLPKGVTRESVDLEMAVGLLSLPRLLGMHPETGAKIKASLGRFGPYVVHDQGKEGKDYRSLKGDDDVLQVTLERALELLAQPKRGRGRKAAKPLRELGKHPETEEPINIYDGPYGPYIKYEKVNASLPEGKKLEDVSLEEALEIIAAKAATKKKTTRRKSTAKKSTTKKTTTAKKSTTKKSTAKSTTKKASTTKKSSPTAAAKKSTAAKGKSTTTRRKKKSEEDAAE
ncbi:MAG: topoisomerase C-terminal repeat-containing protein, partial [Cyanobacteria bacterium P01_F01_bin.116]